MENRQSNPDFGIKEEMISMSNALRIEHLEKLLGYVEERSKYTDYNFDQLYIKLKDEIDLEHLRLDDLKKNPYLNNLRQTIEKQIMSFKEADKNEKAREFKEFIQAFIGDIERELSRMKYSKRI